MPTYVIEVKNLTSEPWYFGAHQEFPDAVGLDSVIWQAALVAVGEAAVFQWGMNFRAVLTDYLSNHVMDVQSVPAKLGDTYQMTTFPIDNITIVDRVPISTGGPLAFSITNNTDPAKPVSVGSMLSGSICAALRDLNPKQTINFPPYARCTVALYQEVQVRDLVNSAVGAAPVIVDYPPGFTRAIVTAYVDSGIVRTKVEYML